MKRANKATQTNMEEDPNEFWLLASQKKSQTLDSLRDPDQCVVQKCSLDKVHGNTKDNVPKSILSHVMYKNEYFFELEYNDLGVANSYYPLWFIRQRFPKLLLEYYKLKSILFIK